MKRFIITISVALAVVAASAQEAWTLDRCIAYALEQSYDVQRAQLALAQAQVAEKMANVAMTPSVNAGIGQNFSFGLAETANNVKVSRTQASTSFNASASMPIFTGLQVFHQIKRAQLDTKAAQAQIDATREQVELSLMSLFFQAIFNREMLASAQAQVDLSDSLVLRTGQLVAAGRKSESELYEVRAQNATYRQNLVEAENAYTLALVDLCQLMNYRDADNFSIAYSETQPDDILLPSPEAVYDKSLESRPSLLAQRTRIQSQEHAVKETKAGFYPQLNLNASWGTGYYHSFNNNNPAFGNQFVNNGSEVVGISLNIPIYNRLQVRSAVKNQQFALTQQRIALQEQESELYKQIQSAYYNATAAQSKLRAAESTEKSNSIALSYAQQKYENGKLSTYELNEAMVRMQNSRIATLQARYDFILRSRILEFYNK